VICPEPNHIELPRSSRAAQTAVDQEGVMDFELSDEQLMLRDSVDRFGTDHFPPSDRLGMLAAGSDPARWRAMAELGWLALMVPEADGGLGGSALDAMIVMEGFGRHLILEPFATSAVFAPALLAAAPVGAALLEQLVAGDIRIAPALAESDSGFDLNRVALSAVPEGDGYRLTGRKTHSEDGADADWFIVSARTSGADDSPDGISLFLVSADAPGLTIERFRAIDHHRHARLDFDGVSLEGGSLIGTIGGGLAPLEEAVDRTIAALLGEAVGSIDALRDITLEHLRTRHQFGVPIGTFQALQHRMVDIDIACEEARSMLYYATLHLTSEPVERRLAVAAAKARVGQTSLFVGRQAVQLHGGLGMSAELIVSHHLKRLMMIDCAFGNASHHKAVFAAAA